MALSVYLNHDDVGRFWLIEQLSRRSMLVDESEIQSVLSNAAKKQ